MTHGAIATARTFSDAKLAELRGVIGPCVPPGVVVVACGSFARREASASSDLDHFIILPDAGREGDDEPAWMAALHDAIASVVPVEPARGGPFAQREHLPGMVRNLGGQGDSNQRLTRRMLFLLEGESLTDVATFRAARLMLLGRYIGPRIGDGMLPLFLLNDLIRYYRTIAVDYEFKTSEADKPWGLRNLKLVFSRKLLYASGLFAIASTRDGPADAKIARLEDLLALTPIDRMATLCGGTAVEPILARYDHFLERLEQPGLRGHLERLTRRDRDDPVFRDLKDAGYAFTRDLQHLFTETFAPDHPIHRAIAF